MKRKFTLNLLILIFVLFSTPLFSNENIDKDVKEIEKKVLKIEAIVSNNLKNKNIHVKKTGNKDRNKEDFYIKKIKFKEIYYHDKDKKVSFYDNNKLIKDIFIIEERIAITTFYNNKKNKIKSIHYHDNKNIYSERFYKNGREIKSIIYNDDKSIRSIRLYINSEYVKTKYHKDGKLDSKTYSKHEEQGKAYKKIDYYRTGEVFDYHQPKDYPETHEVYKKLVKKAENDGEKFEKRTMLTLHDGIHTTYYKNGKKRRFYEQVLGELDGIEIHWYDNGQKSSEIFHIALNPIPKKIKIWHYNGRLLFSGYSKDNRLYDSKNNKPHTGTLYLYKNKKEIREKFEYKNGFITYEQSGSDKRKLSATFYKNNERVKHIFFHGKKKPSYETIYENGKTKTTINYYNNGNIMSKNSYNNGKLVKFIDYFSNGKIKNEGSDKVEYHYDKSGNLIDIYKIIDRNNFSIITFHPFTDKKKTEESFKDKKMVKSTRYNKDGFKMFEFESLSKDKKVFREFHSDINTIMREMFFTEKGLKAFYDSRKDETAYKIIIYDKYGKVKKD